MRLTWYSRSLKLPSPISLLVLRQCSPADDKSDNSSTSSSFLCCYAYQKGGNRTWCVYTYTKKESCIGELEKKKKNAPCFGSAVFSLMSHSLSRMTPFVNPSLPVTSKVPTRTVKVFWSIRSLNTTDDNAIPRPIYV